MFLYYTVLTQTYEHLSAMSHTTLINNRYCWLNVTGVSFHHSDHTQWQQYSSLSSIDAIIYHFVGGPSPDADEVFTIQPEGTLYTSPKKVAMLICSAWDADDIHMRCNREYLKDTQIEKNLVSINGRRLLTVSCDSNIWIWSY